MQGELKYYDALVQYATVTISLAEKDLNEPAAFCLRETARTFPFILPNVEKDLRHEVKARSKTPGFRSSNRLSIATTMAR